MTKKEEATDAILTLQCAISGLEGSLGEPIGKGDECLHWNPEKMLSFEILADDQVAASLVRTWRLAGQWPLKGFRAHDPFNHRCTLTFV